MKKYLVIYEKSSTGYGAYAPDLPGVGTVGATLEEVKHNIKEAIELHLEGLREESDRRSGRRITRRHYYGRYGDGELARRRYRSGCPRQTQAVKRTIFLNKSVGSPLSRKLLIILT